MNPLFDADCSEYLTMNEDDRSFKTVPGTGYTRERETGDTARDQRHVRPGAASVAGGGTAAPRPSHVAHFARGLGPRTALHEHERELDGAQVLDRDHHVVDDGDVLTVKGQQPWTVTYHSIQCWFVLNFVKLQRWLMVMYKKNYS